MFFPVRYIPLTTEAIAFSFLCYAPRHHDHSHPVRVGQQLREEFERVWAYSAEHELPDVGDARTVRVGGEE